MASHGSSTSKYNSNVGIRESDSVPSNGLSRENNDFPRNCPPTFVSRLGRFSVVMLLCSLAVCFGCVAFLTFLWAADTENALWRRIVLAGWVTRSITISSLVLRWATATQAVICTSILAAMLLEAHGVLLSDAAAVSIMRFNNTGPWSLVGRMRGEWHYGSVVIALLALLLSFTTIALQFSSTALLSQVGLASLPVAFSALQTFYGTDINVPTYHLHMASWHSYIETTPKGYPAFAEWAPDATISNTTNHTASGMRDTGTVVRAFLPIEDANERSRLIKYRGFGTAVDMRVVCMRPKLANFVYSSRPSYRITGLVDIEHEPMGFHQDIDKTGSNNFTLPFDCDIFFASQKNYSELHGWPLSLCQPLKYSKKGLSSIMEPKREESYRRSYLLVNATETKSVTSLDSSDVTLCMAAFEARAVEIYANRSAMIVPEPVLTWNTSTAAYSTEAVLRQLGAGKSSVSVAQRGIFDLAPRPWQAPKLAKLPHDEVAILGAGFSTSWALDTMKSDQGEGKLVSGYINKAQYSILAQMASTTRDPALALQAFFTTLFAITYYDRITMFDVAAPSSGVSLIQVIRPLGWTAYIVVMSAVLVHLLLVLLTTLMFYRAGKLSWIGNSWPAVSQIFGPATDSWIGHADAVDDKRVKVWLRARGLERTTLVRVKDSHGDRVQLVDKDKVL